MHRRFVLVGLCAIGVAAGGTGCDTPCNFRILDRLDSGTGQVGCCGGSATQEIVIPDERDLAIDIAQIATSPRTGGQDVYLTGTDCAVLFDAPYPEPGTGPRPVPRCQVLAGPWPLARLTRVPPFVRDAIARSSRPTRPTHRPTPIASK